MAGSPLVCSVTVLSLAFAGMIGMVIGLLIAFLIEFRRLWGWSLDQPWGEFWPVPAALLPACIPFARSVEQDDSKLVQTGIVVTLLLAVAVLQVYGQQRNQRDRLKTESAFDEQSTLLNAVAVAIAEQGAAIAEQGDEGRERTALLGRIADGIAAEPVRDH